MAPGETGGKWKFIMECHRNDWIWLRAFWHATARCIRAMRRCAMNAMRFDFNACVARLFFIIAFPQFHWGLLLGNPFRGSIQAKHNNVCWSYRLSVIRGVRIFDWGHMHAGGPARDRSGKPVVGGLCVDGLGTDSPTRGTRGAARIKLWQRTLIEHNQY